MSYEEKRDGIWSEAKLWLELLELVVNNAIYMDHLHMPHYLQ